MFYWFDKGIVFWCEIAQKRVKKRSFLYPFCIILIPFITNIS
jgi:hypothetical protein